MSPNMFSVTTTSKSRGREIRCMAIASTRTTSYCTSGNSSDMMRAATCRQSRETSGQSHDPLNFARRINHRVPGLFAAGVRPTAGFPEIEASRQFANEQDVDAFDDLPFERRGVDELPVRGDRTRVGEEIKFLADLEEAGFGSRLGAGIVPFRATDGA